MSAAPANRPQWAESATFTEGDLNGSPTKVAPATRELTEGNLPGPSFPPSCQKFNWWQQLISAWTRYFGQYVKQPCQSVATSNIASLSGLSTVIDGVTYNADGMRPFLSAQVDQTQNGPWLAHSGAWTRPTDFQAGDAASGAAYRILGGTKAGSTWLCTNAEGSDVVGTNNLTFVQSGGPSAGLTIVHATGNVGPATVDTCYLFGSLTAGATLTLHANPTDGARIEAWGSPDSNFYNVTVVSATVATTGASFTMPAIGSDTGSVLVDSSANLAVGQYVFLGVNRMRVATKPDATHVTLTNLKDMTNAAPGATVATSQAILRPIERAGSDLLASDFEKRLYVYDSTLGLYRKAWLQ